MKDEGNLVLGTKKFQEKTKRWKVTVLQKKFIQMFVTLEKAMSFPQKSGQHFKQQDRFYLNTPPDSDIQAKNVSFLCCTNLYI